jgi:hypothetical protein
MKLFKQAFVFKHEGNRIQHSFNSERADKLAKLESLIKIKDLTAASKLLTEEREILRCGTFKGAESSVDYSRNIFQQTVVVVPDCRLR